MPPISGTSVAVVRPMERIPPMITRPTSAAMISPTTSPPVVEDRKPVPSESRTVTIWL